MIEKRPSVGNQEIDFVGFSYKLATYFPLPFWILIYNFNLLPILLPFYKGKDLEYPLFIVPAVLFTAAVTIKGICQIVIYKIEKDRFPDPEKKNLFLKIPLNKLLFEYIEKKSYGTLFLIMILWVSEFIAISTFTTMIFGIFITLRY